MRLVEEISDFFGIPQTAVIQRLALGFGHQHAEVRADFNRANPQTDEELLNWYRTTDSYIWELAAYHMDPGFNYEGMCAGIVGRLKAGQHVLNLGDGIGTLTLKCYEADIDAVYHDLADSRTASFAESRMPDLDFVLSMDWHPPAYVPESYDAVVSLDFLEHVTDVPEWTRFVYAALKPGGIFLAQNAFACGSGPDGSIPMHLTRNDKYEHEWVPLLNSIGFTQISTSNWWQK